MGKSQIGSHLQFSQLYAQSSSHADQLEHRFQDILRGIKPDATVSSNHRAQKVLDTHALNTESKRRSRQLENLCRLEKGNPSNKSYGFGQYEYNILF